MNNLIYKSAQVLGCIAILAFVAIVSWAACDFHRDVQMFNKTVEGYVVELIDVLRGEAVRDEQGMADYNSKGETPK